jgi:FkbM family methyltransferase
MKKTTKVIHSLILIFNLESFIISLFIRTNNETIKKLIPLHNNYRRPSIRKVVRDSTLFELDISDYMQWYIWAGLKDLSWEFAANSLKGNCTILDIGANVGAFCLKLCAYSVKINFNSTVIAFEPNPYVLKNLYSNLSFNEGLKKSILIEPLGVSNKKEQLEFQWNKKNTGGGRFIVEKKGLTKSVELINVVKIDDYVKEKSISNISFIKIDVEGFEPFVLQGAMQTIKKFKPNIFIEVSPKWWNKNGFSVKEVLQCFEELNYVFYPLVNEEIGGPEAFNTLLEKKDQFNLFLKYG